MPRSAKCSGERPSLLTLISLRARAPLLLTNMRAVDQTRRSRHIPRPVYKAAQLKRTMEEAQRVKEERRRRHTRAGESKPKAERKKVVIAEQS